MGIIVLLSLFLVEAYLPLTLVECGDVKDRRKRRSDGGYE
jgi:hypothetical protein